MGILLIIITVLGTCLIFSLATSERVWKNNYTLYGENDNEK